MKNEFADQDEKEEKRMNAVYETRKDNYYREINLYRRHYSQLRFAVFPLYLAIQAGLLRFSFSYPDNVQSYIPLEYLFSGAGIFLTCVFWTIEYRILRYYNYLCNVGSFIEEEYGQGYNMITEWPGNSNKNSEFLLKGTKYFIIATYFFFIVYWAIAAFYCSVH